MREIKFRAWDNYHKKMQEWYSFKTSKALQTLFNGTEYTFLQYTGLKDKNGKEIYEGDVVSLAGYGDYEVEFPFLQLYESSFENDIGEIIGNIYDLKEKN